MTAVSRAELVALRSGDVVRVTVVDAWQGRGLGSALLARLSERAQEAGIEHFAAEVLAESRPMPALLPSLGRVESEPLGPVVTARVELTDPRRPV